MHAAKAKRHERHERHEHAHVIPSEDIGRETWSMRNGAAFLAPGYVLLPELSSQGGSSADDYTESRSKSGARHVSFTKTVDHPELAEAAQKAITAARYVLYTHAARFVAGSYFVSDAEFEKLDEQLDEARRAAVLCNRTARQLKSERVTVIEIYRLKLDVQDQRLALRLGASIHERLSMLRASYTGETRRTYQTATVACTNLDRLVTGAQREIVRLALASADSQRPLMIAHYGGKKGVGEVLREFKGKLPGFDYGPIDAALKVFAPAAAALERSK